MKTKFIMASQSKKRRKIILACNLVFHISSKDIDIKLMYHWKRETKRKVHNGFPSIVNTRTKKHRDGFQGKPYINDRTMFCIMKFRVMPKLQYVQGLSNNWKIKNKDEAFFFGHKLSKSSPNA
ncbi:hypothetical protein AMTRI_Chr09g41760 [Amborella trichopoda]